MGFLAGRTLLFSFASGFVFVSGLVFVQDTCFASGQVYLLQDKCNCFRTIVFASGQV